MIYEYLDTFLVSISLIDFLTHFTISFWKNSVTNKYTALKTGRASDRDF